MKLKEFFNGGVVVSVTRGSRCERNPKVIISRASISKTSTVLRLFLYAIFIIKVFKKRDVSFFIPLFTNLYGIIIL